MSENKKIPWSHFKWVLDLSAMMLDTGHAMTQSRSDAAYKLYCEGKSVEETFDFITAMPDLGHTS